MSPGAFVIGIATGVDCLRNAVFGKISLSFEHQLYDFGSLALSGLELPSADRVNRGVDEHWISTQHAGGLDRSVGPDHGFYSDRAMDVHLFRQVGIVWCNPRCDLTLGAGLFRGGGGTLGGSQTRRQRYERYCHE